MSLDIDSPLVVSSRNVSLQVSLSSHESTTDFNDVVPKTLRKSVSVQASILSDSRSSFENNEEDTSKELVCLEKDDLGNQQQYVDLK